MDKNYVKTAVGQGIDHIATQTWLRGVPTHKQCSNYKIFKHEKCLETYLLKLNFSDMTKVCQFRCGNHKLRIASGRFLDTQPPPPNTVPYDIQPWYADLSNTCLCFNFAECGVGEVMKVVKDKYSQVLSTH